MAIYLGKNRVSYQIVTVPPINNIKKSALNFYDYDGILLHSYSRTDALALTELLSLPDRTSEGLVCQGWNWTLDDIKTYLNEYETGYVNVGPMYTTADGATWIDINIPDDARLNHPLMFKGNVTIDWGDGNTETKNHTSATVVTHNYVTSGKYRIKLTVNSGTLSLGKNSSDYNICGDTSNIGSNPGKVYSNRVENVFIGNSVTSIDSAFHYCYSLRSITIPNSVTSIGSYTFNYCSSLRSITVPNSVTSINNYAFQTCPSLQSIIVPNSVTSIGYAAFYSCYSLQSMTIPNSVTSISQSAFQNCYPLQSITIPNSVTSIGQAAFSSCYSLQSITISNSVKSIGTNVFTNCWNLQSIIIPNSVTSIGGTAFGNCYSLRSITIPNSVTSIGGSAFSTCYSLQSITIPNSVTSIGGSAFNNCYGIVKYDFSTHTSVPSLVNTSAFSSTVDDKKIIVPDALYDEWIAATNWATYASYIVKASEYNK